jgi:NAD(P)-dependent dehydrogenase (short-subunit alcohol dehydrogenase family)
MTTPCKAITHHSPRVGRAGSATDIAPAILFLCSEGARWINGANLPVDGGLEASINATVLGF